MIESAGMFRRLFKTIRDRRTRRWILSLDQAGLLALMLRTDTGLDKQDCDALVQLAYNTYPDGHRDAIIDRIIEHLHV